MALTNQFYDHEVCWQAHSIFVNPPIVPKIEMCAYEALWIGSSAWFKSVADLFRSNPGKTPSELVTPHDIETAHKKLSEMLGEDLDKVGVRVNGAGEYPSKLRDADHPVELLYFLGKWELVDTPCVAVVGTRNPSPEGEHQARRIANALVRSNYTVVSGLAKGIDTAAHEAAISAGGRTIAVIGTPLNETYPKQNRHLQDYISRKHLVISQVPFLRYRMQSYKANRLFFPARNVTMSALTRATIIVEAGNTSGTLIQARAALAQNRKLFILETCFRNRELTWPEKFEQMGAIRVQTVAEIVDRLSEG